MRKSDITQPDNHQGRPTQDQRNNRKERGYVQYSYPELTCRDFLPRGVVPRAGPVQSDRSSSGRRYSTKRGTFLSQERKLTIFCNLFIRNNLKNAWI
jgi:hypothetical protein